MWGDPPWNFRSHVTEWGTKRLIFFLAYREIDRKTDEYYLGEGHDLSGFMHLKYMFRNRL